MRKLVMGALMAGTLLAGCGLNPGMTSGVDGQVSAQAKRGLAGTPSWVKDAVFYQIFPDRFENGNKANDPKDTQDWETGKPTYYNYFGGDLAGVTQKIPYLKQLGINAIYFNPIFASDSNHKYTTTDYTKIDPGFGTLADFDKMVATAHSAGIRVILDGVFNHTSDNFWAFQQAKTTGPNDPHWNWYHFNGFPVQPGSYWTYMGFGFMPQLNIPGDASLRQYLLNDVVAYWTKRHIDGWRLDVPLMVQSNEFWQGFRTTVKGINPNAYIVGEAWENHGDDARPWVQGDKFDAVMNYQFYQNALDYFAHDAINTDAFDGRMMDLRGRFPADVTMSEFNVIGTHDTSRFLGEAGNNVKRLMMAAAFQMTYLGAPVIYYGDEIGMTGGNDPDNRRPMAWSHPNATVASYYKQLIAIRNANPALRSNQFSTLMRHNDFGQMVYQRTDGKDTFLVALNKSNNAVTLDATNGNLGHVAFADGTRFTDLLTNQTFTVSGGKLVIQTGPSGAAILKMSGASRR